MRSAAKARPSIATQSASTVRSAAVALPQQHTRHGASLKGDAGPPSLPLHGSRPTGTAGRGCWTPPSPRLPGTPQRTPRRRQATAELCFDCLRPVYTPMRYPGTASAIGDAAGPSRPAPATWGGPGSPPAAEAQGRQQRSRPMREKPCLSLGEAGQSGPMRTGGGHL